MTTRPVGYRAAHFAEWRHYDLAPLDPSHAATHVAKLLEALSDDDQQGGFDKVAADQLKNREIREIVGRTPLLLGMAAAVLASGRDLGSTRETLFEQIFALVDDIPRRSLSKPAGDAVLNRMLDILAWHLTAQPLLPCPEMERLCAADLAVETGDPVLKAADLAQSILAYWEDAGLIERVGSGSVQVYGFIHKSLGEFAAARRLCELPEPRQLEALQQCMADSAWNEVLRFAGLRGPADQVAAQIAGLPARSSDLADKLSYGARLLAEVPERVTPPRAEAFWTESSRWLQRTANQRRRNLACRSLPSPSFFRMTSPPSRRAFVMHHMSGRSSLLGTASRLPGHNSTRSTIWSPRSSPQSRPGPSAWRQVLAAA